MVLQFGTLTPLLQQLIQNAKASLLRNATWTLSNLCRGKPQPSFELVRPSLPVLSQLIHSQDVEVLTDACWALSYLSDGPNEKIQVVIESGVCRRLVELLNHPSLSVQTPALRTIGNIATGDDLQTQIITNCSVLPSLLTLLRSGVKRAIRKEACWTISNITAGNKDQIQAVIGAGIIPPLIKQLANGEADVSKEAAWAISNATSGGSAEQINYLVKKGCIRPMCDLLALADVKTITVALEGLENILKAGDHEAKQEGGTSTNRMCILIEEAGGLSKIQQQFQQHENHDTYEKAKHVLEVYFEAEEGGETNAKKGAA
jgi:hypothetical protein